MVRGDEGSCFCLGLLVDGDCNSAPDKLHFIALL